ncbi:hypothetical protein TWF481_004189 [Arthrobotrys musiformis]|uniref:Uncharacterized protein n=1 Tax=Arthrobotrys musiformis TaxID=47236 RepID=A0AAV9WIS9_9PEZI
MAGTLTPESLPWVYFLEHKFIHVNEDPSAPETTIHKRSDPATFFDQVDDILSLNPPPPFNTPTETSGPFYHVATLCACCICPHCSVALTQGQELDLLSPPHGRWDEWSSRRPVDGNQIHQALRLLPPQRYTPPTNQLQQLQLQPQPPTPFNGTDGNHQNPPPNSAAQGKPGPSSANPPSNTPQ